MDIFTYMAGNPTMTFLLACGVLIMFIASCVTACELVEREAFKTWVKGREARLLAREAHERACPRFSDKPRNT